MNTLPPDNVIDFSKTGDNFDALDQSDTFNPQDPKLDKQIKNAFEDIERKNFVRMVAGGLFINRSGIMTTEECWIDAKKLWEVKPKDC